MVYVMSDIHGEYEVYQKMLKKIGFCDKDTLYVLGDVIDRKEGGIKILKDMMMRPNVIPILGNHEYVAIACMPHLLSEKTMEAMHNVYQKEKKNFDEWIVTGGQETVKEFCELTLEEREDVIEYLSIFQRYDEIKVNGKTFILVHAGLENYAKDRALSDYDLEELLFEKPDYEVVYDKEKYLVTGHTPTRFIYAAEEGLLSDEINPTQYQDRIFKKNHHIAIDCGSGYGGNLGCLCLDTMEEYYVKTDVTI